MSLDTLFQQILLTEQHMTERTQRFKEVKVALIRWEEKLKSAAEKQEDATAEIDQKAQQLSVMRLQRDLMKKCEDQMLKQIEEMLCQKNNLREHLFKIKSVSKDEEQNFLQEISRFNDEFSLQEDRETGFESQMHTEILDLEREVESLYKEMEQMSHRNGHMSSMQEEKRALQFELQGLDNNLKDLDRQLSEAEAMTDSLKAEILFVSQKPFTDSTCLRLRKELELHKEGELELLREAQFLHSCVGSIELAHQCRSHGNQRSGVELASPPRWVPPPPPGRDIMHHRSSLTVRQPLALFRDHLCKGSVVFGFFFYFGRCSLTDPQMAVWDSQPELRVLVMSAQCAA